MAFFLTFDYKFTSVKKVINKIITSNVTILKSLVIMSHHPGLKRGPWRRYDLEAIIVFFGPLLNQHSWKKTLDT